jgi:hypothetical protein
MDVVLLRIQGLGQDQGAANMGKGNSFTDKQD